MASIYIYNHESWWILVHPLVIQHGWLENHQVLNCTIIDKQIVDFSGKPWNHLQKYLKIPLSLHSWSLMCMWHLRIETHSDTVCCFTCCFANAFGPLKWRWGFYPREKWWSWLAVRDDFNWLYPRYSEKIRLKWTCNWICMDLPSMWRNLWLLPAYV